MKLDHATEPAATADPGMVVQMMKRDSSPVDERVLRDLMSQMGDTEGELLNELIDSYVAEAADLVVELDVAARANDGDAVATIAHQLKSTSALLGALTLAELLRQAEHIAHTAPADLSSVTGPIRAEHLRVVKALVRLSPAVAAGNRALAGLAD